MSQYGYSSGGPLRDIPFPPAVAPRAQAGGAWRVVFAIAMGVLGCLVAPAALAGVWFHSSIMEVDGWVATVTPVADEPAVQEVVADVLSEQISGALDAGWTLPGLPDEFDIIPSLGTQGLADLTRELTLQAVSSGAFRGFWAAANRRVHPILLDAVEGTGETDLTADGLVSLDLGDVTRNVTDLLAVSGVSLPDVFPEALTNGDVMLLSAEPLAEAGNIIFGLDRLFWLLPMAVLGFFLSSVLVARTRLLALVWVGVGLGLGMAVLEAGVVAAQAYYLGVTDDAGIPHDASAAIFGVVTSGLRFWGWVILAAGFVVALAATAAHLIARRRGSAPRQAGPAYPNPAVGPGHPGGTRNPGYPG